MQCHNTRNFFISISFIVVCIMDIIYVVITSMTIMNVAIIFHHFSSILLVWLQMHIYPTIVNIALSFSICVLITAQYLISVSNDKLQFALQKNVTNCLHINNCDFSNTVFPLWNTIFIFVINTYKLNIKQMPIDLHPPCSKKCRLLQFCNMKAITNLTIQLFHSSHILLLMRWLSRFILLYK